MTITVLPIDAASGAPSYTAQATRQAFSGLFVNGTARPVGAQSGVVAGHAPALSATSSVWSVGAGAFIVDVAFTTTQAPYLIANDTTVTGSLTAANATLDRYDSIYLQVNDTAIDSSGLRSAVIGVVTGTPASSPTVPAVPARSMFFGYIFVPRVGGGSPSATLFPVFSVASGGVLPVSDATSRDSIITNPYDGMTIYNMALNRLQAYNGGSWDDFSPTTTGLVSSVTTDATGVSTTSHGLSGTPRSVQVTQTGPDVALSFRVSAVTSTTFSVRWRTASTGSPLVSTAVGFYWTASL